MSYVQITRPYGDLNRLPAAQYNGNLETLQGVVRLIDAMLQELYSVVTSGGVVVGGTSLVTDNAPGSGTITGYAPTGFGTDTDRLDILANAANTTLNDIPAGADGQKLRIRNTGTVGTLTLVNGSRFSGIGDLALMPGESADLIYYAGSVARWTM